MRLGLGGVRVMWRRGLRVVVVGAVTPALGVFVVRCGSSVVWGTGLSRAFYGFWPGFAYKWGHSILVSEMQERPILSRFSKKLV